MLTISKPNDKLKKALDAWSLDLSAGASCPGAVHCFAQAIRNEEGKIKILDVPERQDPEKWRKRNGITDENRFRCFAAVSERFPNVLDSRKRNLETLKGLKTVKQMADLIFNSIQSTVPKHRRKYFRLHASGDFFNEKYFLAWLEVVRRMPDTTFYAYTKVYPFVKKHDKDIPKNLRITLSVGGKWDKEVLEYAKSKKRTHNIAFVTFTPEEAAKKNLKIDSNDTLAATSSGDFALLLHGMQDKNTRASKALQNRKMAS